MPKKTVFNKVFGFGKIEHRCYGLTKIKNLYEYLCYSNFLKYESLFLLKNCDC